MQPVIVGVDGSALALHAVRWAAHEAVLRKAPLHIVHVAIPSSPGSPSLPVSLADTLVAAGRQWLTDAADLARATAPDLDVTTDLIRGYPQQVLVDESASAELVVLGARGQGGFADLLMGSIAGAVATHGRCPVAVIREEAPESGPVVVGVDGSPASEAAIAFAYDEAARRGASLVAVHTWSDTIAAATFSMVPYAVDWAEVQTEEQQILAERLAGWQEKYPDVEVRRVITRDHPAHSLIQEAQDAQLLVVGSRGRGTVTGMLLGSTSQAALHHAPCPLVIVRPD